MIVRTFPSKTLGRLRAPRIRDELGESYIIIRSSSAKTACLKVLAKWHVQSSSLSLIRTRTLYLVSCACLCCVVY